MFNCKLYDLSYTGQYGTQYIRESVDSLCRDGADAEYMQYLSKCRIIKILMTIVLLCNLAHNTYAVDIPK